MSDPTQDKRQQLADFIEQKLVDEPAVKAVIGVGSTATGHAHPDSDIDAIVFMDPLDLYVVPAESIWRPRDDTFHSIMADDETLDAEGIQLDLHRLDLAVWRDPAYDWPEPTRAELADGWIAYDRDGDVVRLIAERTAYPDELRLRTLDEALPLIYGQLPDVDSTKAWNSLGPVIASDRLQAIYEHFVQALFAYNKKWRIWRTREMSALLQLPWLPADTEEHIQAAAISAGHDRVAYLARAAAIRHLFDQLVQRMVADGLYGDDPDSEAFIRGNEEPGRAWNMDAWNEQHAQRRVTNKPGFP